MARFYIPVDRDQEFLLPVSMREWLPEDHLALFVIELVATLELSGLHRSYRSGAQGRSAYDPGMLLTLWVYATCIGVRSSREIERRCRSDIAYRFLCANRVPDHTTLARFRQRCDAVIEELFCQLLGVCAEAGVLRLGLVALDGTKVAANAALGATHYEQTIRAEVRKLLDAAAEMDAAEDRLFGDRRGDELPEGLNRAGRDRLVRLQAAAARAAQRTAQAAGDPEAKLAGAKSKDAASVAATGRHRRGHKTLGPDPIGEAEADLAEARSEHQRARDDLARARAEARATGGPPPTRHAYSRTWLRQQSAERRLARLRARAAEGRLVTPTAEVRGANTTDPDSAVLPTAHGWVQGYNVQAVVDEGQLIVAVGVCDTPADVTQFEPMIAATAANLQAAGISERPAVIVADAGYWSEANAIARAGDGSGDARDDEHRPERLIATTKSYKLRQARQRQAAHGPPPAGATPLEAMEHRLRTPEGSALYAKRAITVEPVFGQLKEHQRLRRFLRRGRSAVLAEATFAAAAHNVLKLFVAHAGGPAMA